MLPSVARSSPGRPGPRARALRRLPLLLATLLLFAACSPPGAAGRDDVVASFYPLQWVAERVLGPETPVANLTAPGVEPHDLELTVRQAATISQAEVLVYEKGFQPAVDQSVANEPPQQVLDVASVVSLVDAPADDGGGLDPHFWLDPTLLSQVAARFTEVMAEVDPAGASGYRERNRAVQTDLRALDADFRRGLATCRTRTVVVSHDAFEYLGRRYDLDVHAVAGLTPDAEPSPRHLAELGRLARDRGVTTVFNETLASPRLTDALAGDLGLGTAVLDPLEGLVDGAKGADYLSVMRANLAALRSAGSCS